MSGVEGGWALEGVSPPSSGKVWGEEYCRQFQQADKQPLWNQCTEAEGFMKY